MPSLPEAVSEGEGLRKVVDYGAAADAWPEVRDRYGWPDGRREQCAFDEGFIAARRAAPPLDPQALAEEIEREHKRLIADGAPKYGHPALFREIVLRIIERAAGRRS